MYRFHCGCLLELGNALHRMVGSLWLHIPDVDLMSIDCYVMVEEYGAVPVTRNELIQFVINT